MPFLAIVAIFLGIEILAIPTDEQKLLETVLYDYNQASRPVFNAANTVVVKFGITLTQISDMVSKIVLFFVLLFMYCSFVTKSQQTTG